MTVLSVAYPFAAVSKDGTGGAEQVVAQLDEGLVRHGHRSLVVAASGSQVAGELIPFTRSVDELTETSLAGCREEYRRLTEDALARLRPDVVHYHGFDCPSYFTATICPRVVTLHLPLSFYEPDFLASPEATLVCVSHSQARSAHTTLSDRIIGNGVDLEVFKPAVEQEDYALMLTRICPEKGVAAALRVAHQFDFALSIAGEVFPYPAHQRYFTEAVCPLLDSRRCFLGPAGLDAKRELIARARCLLVASTVAETSSLVAMEAAASGTPVIALRAGALPEIVVDSVTGFLVDREDEMGVAWGRLAQIERRACRRHAEESFDVRRTVDQYIGLYANLVREPVLHEAIP